MPTAHIGVADSTEFNAYVTIDPLTQSDGINRISVRLAKDNEGFPCPTENVRFECRISSTGSLSAGFAAVGDTGKIHLDWGIPDEAIDDYLGTNMYRIDSTDLTNAKLRVQPNAGRQHDDRYDGASRSMVRILL